MTAFSSKTLGSTKSMRSNKKRQETRGTGPLSKHMEPRNFQKMQVNQKNSSRYFRPRVKLRTDMLHKVLYKLKKEKGALDHSLERLEMVSNFGETKLKIDYQHTNIIRDLNIKANPKNAYVHIPLKRKKKKKNGMRKIKSAMPRTMSKDRPMTAMTKFMGSESFKEAIEEVTDNKKRMEEFYKNMNERYQMHKMTRRHSSYIQQGRSNLKAKKYLEDEIRKNSHHHYWVPEDIMYIKGKPLKKALKHLEIKNLRKMNKLKKNQYKEFSGGSKPSILPLRGNRNALGLEIQGKAIEDISLQNINRSHYDLEEEFQRKFNNYLSSLPLDQEETDLMHDQSPNGMADDSYSQTYTLTEKQRNHLSKYRSGGNFEIIEDEGSDESCDLDNIPNLKAGMGDNRLSKTSAYTTSTRPHTAINRIGSMKRPISSRPTIKEEI